MATSAYLARAVEYAPYFVSHGSTWVDDENNWSMKTNRDLRGLFVSQMADYSNEWWQTWTTYDISPWNDQGVFYSYYFITQTEFNGGQYVRLGFNTGQSPLATQIKSETRITNSFITQTNISLGGENWNLFFIPEGRYDTTQGVCNTMIFEGFDKDVIFVSRENQGSPKTWSQISGGSKSKIVHNDWQIYYDIRDLGGRSPSQIEQEAYQDGYNAGTAVNLASGQNGVWTLVSNGFNAVGGVLGMELAPNITLGGIFAIPLMGLVLFFLLKMVKGNG